jgi:hypothetical protein
MIGGSSIPDVRPVDLEDPSLYRLNQAIRLLAERLALVYDLETHDSNASALASGLRRGWPYRTSAGVVMSVIQSVDTGTIGAPLPVGSGGTGANTLADHGVMLGSGTAAVTVTGAGNAGEALTSNGGSADPTFQAISVFTDRGDPAAADRTQATLIADSVWRDWDLSSVVPAGAKSVLLRVYGGNTGVAEIQFRKNGNSNAYNVAKVATQVAGVAVGADVTVACDANRVIEYYLANVGTWTVTVTIAGWWK